MGAWGSGSFENDDALDWVAELEDTDDLSLVLETLEAVTEGGSEYLEAPDCCAALAAAEVLAALAGRPSPSLPEEVSGWVKGKGGADSDALATGVRAVDAILAASELQELWEDSDEFDSWKAAVADLRKRLGA